MPSKKKLIDRMVERAPAILQARRGKGPACIYVTAVAISCLREVGIQAEPLPVKLTILNPPYARWRTEGGVGSPPPDSYSVGIDVSAPKPGSWNGHVVVHLSRNEAIADLDLGTYRRPASGIELPDAAVFQWPTGTTASAYRTANGAALIYEEISDRTFLSSPIWTRLESGEYDEVVSAIVKAMSKV